MDGTIDQLHFGMSVSLPILLSPKVGGHIHPSTMILPANDGERLRKNRSHSSCKLSGQVLTRSFSSATGFRLRQLHLAPLRYSDRALSPARTPHVKQDHHLFDRPTVDPALRWSTMQSI
jgi:hypothetical protein